MHNINFCVVSILPHEAKYLMRQNNCWSYLLLELFTAGVILPLAVGVILSK